MSFITNWVTDKISDYAKVGLQAGGSMAGNAVGGVGTMVENAGKTAGGTVSGGIGGVGGYINNYGDSIKRSMSSDGPVSQGQKKTAVKPSGAVGAPQQVKNVGGAVGQPKALPASAGAGAGKAVSTAGSTASRSASAVVRPAGGAVKGVANGAPRKPVPANTRPASAPPKPVGAQRTPTKNANGAASSPRNQPMGKVQNKTTDGKVKVSATSRPGATRAPVKAMDPKKHNAGDPLGMGGLGDFGKKK